MSISWAYNKRNGLRLNDTFLQLFCEKNSDGTKKLRYKGNELQQRFGDRLLPADMLHVCCFLKNHPEVNEIDLSYNGIEDEGLEILCEKTLKHENGLEHVVLGNCDITSEGMKAFYSAAADDQMKIKTLRIFGNKIGPQGGHLMALAMPHIPTLEYLDLGDTDQTSESINCVCSQASLGSIKVLNLSRAIGKTNLQQTGDVFISEDVSELFRLTGSLVEIHVQKCGLDAHDIETMISGLKLNTSLKFLDVGNNHICCVGVEFLSDWLKTRPSLLGLCLSGNSVRDHGGVALSFGMPFSRVRYLDISHNHIGNEGIVAILNSIKKPFILRYFLLWGNHFTHPANKIIQRMMRSGVFEQDGIDVKVYEVDGVLYAARYPIDKYKHRYYDVTDYGCAVELKIKRNLLETPNDLPRPLVKFEHIDRYPPVCRCGNKPCYC